VVVYSPGYRVSFFGIENFHPADTHRSDRIAAYLMDQGLVQKDGFRIPEEASVEQLQAVHSVAYLESLSNAKDLTRALEVPIPDVMGGGIAQRRVLAPFRRATGGTVEAAQVALKHGLAINLGGGFHHARPELGHGFCVYNDVALAVDTLRRGGFEAPILIIDTDAHQGDGNHAFFSDDSTVYSFSMHQGDIFPIPKLLGDRDIALSAGIDDETFLGILSHELEQLPVKPGLVFHVAGSDVLNDDPLANMALTIDGLVQRDLMVAGWARQQNIPLVHLLAGGYGPSAAKAQGRSAAALLRGEWRNP